MKTNHGMICQTLEREWTRWNWIEIKPIDKIISSAQIQISTFHLKVKIIMFFSSIIYLKFVILIYYSSISERVKFEFFTNRYLNLVMKEDLNAHVHLCMSIKLLHYLIWSIISRARKYEMVAVEHINTVIRVPFFILR